MTALRHATLTYSVATPEGNVPAIRIRLRAGERIPNAEWPAMEQAIRSSGIGVVAVMHAPTDTYTYIAVQLSTTLARHTAAALEADCRAICRAANIQIVRGPEPMPE